MQLQSQLLRENTRVLTDVTSEISTPIISTPKKNPQTDVTRLGRSAYSSPAYSSSMYTSQTPLTMSTASQTKPKKTLAATFCGYPSDDKDMDILGLIAYKRLESKLDTVNRCTSPIKSN